MTMAFKSLSDAIHAGREIREATRIRNVRDKTDDRIHASDLTTCPRKLSLKWMKARETNPRSPQSKLIFDVGHAYHKMLQDYCAAVGINIRSDEEGNPFEVGNDDMVGHPDQLTLVDGHLEVVDFKSISHDGWVRINGPKPDDVVQVTPYLGFLGVRFGRIVYVSKTTGEIKECPFEFSPSLWRDILDNQLPRLMQMKHDAIQNGTIQPIPQGYSERSYPCYYRTKAGDEHHCEFSNICWKGAPVERKIDRLPITKTKDMLLTQTITTPTPSHRERSDDPVLAKGVLAP